VKNNQRPLYAVWFRFYVARRNTVSNTHDMEEI